MADLYGTTVAANARKVAATTQFGTPVLGFYKVVIGGGSTPDLSTTPTASDSNFAKAVLALQGYAELFMVGTPDATSFVFAVNANTANDSDVSTNVPGGWGDAEANILAALGSWGSGTVTITALAASGSSIA